VLIIKHVAPADQGRYTCVARNALGSCSTSASISIAPDTIIITPGYQSF
jgi:hypothetical protein